MTRRQIMGILAGSILTPEGLWSPGKKTISVPKVLNPYSRSGLTWLDFGGVPVALKYRPNSYFGDIPLSVEVMNPEGKKLISEVRLKSTFHATPICNSDNITGFMLPVYVNGVRSRIHYSHSPKHKIKSLSNAATRML